MTPETSPSTVEKSPGHFLKEWRRYMRMNQAQFAAYVGLSTSNYNYLEAGKIGYTQKSLETIARALEVAPADLLSLNPLEPPPPPGDAELNELFRTVEELSHEHLEMLSEIAGMFLRRQQANRLRSLSLPRGAKKEKS